eukprot:CAMPEP_0118906250 /NCGR_PEP_ID=MMETSP1166-20130328/9984_1 /TAXON_ID=1104430 /ORGANISM="Chrysoreinhardia sp, Strain CCMP3193" /LENGTH=80 /DNA_ID=CAMNT_0006845535 /DNA_START=475 /DNA_END=717 /DNA_ORIENTATION=-
MTDVNSADPCVTCIQCLSWNGGCKAELSWTGSIPGNSQRQYHMLVLSASPPAEQRGPGMMPGKGAGKVPGTSPCNLALYS